MKRAALLLPVLFACHGSDVVVVPANFTARFCVDSLNYEVAQRDATGKVLWRDWTQSKVTGRWCLDFGLVDSADLSGSLGGGGRDTVTAPLILEDATGVDTIVGWLLFPASVEGSFDIRGDTVLLAWNDPASAQWLATTWFTQTHLLSRPWQAFRNEWRYGPDADGVTLYADIWWRRE